MNNNLICKCGHKKKNHRKWGYSDDLICSIGWDFVSNTIRKPKKFLVCSCNNFQFNNLDYLEKKYNEQSLK